jgi:hypothetical protein
MRNDPADCGEMKLMFRLLLHHTSLVIQANVSESGESGETRKNKTCLA